MPTKDELLTFTTDMGITASSSWAKADIESAVSAAGYDPETLQAWEDEEPMSETVPEPEAGEPVSTQAQFSTYEEMADVPDENPPLGTFVEQTLGPPSEDPVPRFGE